MTIFLEALNVEIIENKENITLKELIDLYGENYTPPYFIKNFSCFYPLSEFFKNKFIQLEKLEKRRLEELKKSAQGVPNDCSRSWKRYDKAMDKVLSSQILRKN